MAVMRVGPQPHWHSLVAKPDQWNQRTEKHVTGTTENMCRTHDNRDQDRLLFGTCRTYCDKIESILYYVSIIVLTTTNYEAVPN